MQNLGEMEAQMKKKKYIYIYYIMHHLAEPHALAHEVSACIYILILIDFSINYLLC